MTDAERTSARYLRLFDAHGPGAIAEQLGRALTSEEAAQVRSGVQVMLTAAPGLDPAWFAELAGRPDEDIVQEIVNLTPETAQKLIDDSRAYVALGRAGVA